MSAELCKQPPPPRPAWSRTQSQLLIALFALAIVTPSLVHMSGYGYQETSELRVLATFPKWDHSTGLKVLPKAVDAYLNDHFGLRGQLVRLNGLGRYKLGASSNRNIVIGRDGWLFYAYPNEKILEQHTGINIITAAELQKWIQVMTANRNWLARRGIPFIILAAPEKSTIYPEKLPTYPRPPAATTRPDQLAVRLRDSDLDFIDPRSALLKAKADGQQIYFQSDSHWTQRGAWIAYALLMERVKAYFPNLEATKLEDYVSTWQLISGDLAPQLALQADLKYKVEFLARRETHQLGSEYRQPGQGWGWGVTFNRTDLAGAPRLLVFGDSFTSYVLGPSFLYETFRDPVFTHHNGGNFDFRLIEEIKPNLVVFQLAERYLSIPVVTPLGF